MAEEKKEVPKHIKKFYELDSYVNKLLATTEAVHSEAYLKGLDVIRDKNGQIDYEMLNEVKNQDAMLKKMVDHYMTQASKSLKTKIPDTEIEREIMFQQYAGITSGNLKKIMRKTKSNYTIHQHEGLRSQLINEQRKRLLPIRSGHFEDEHIGDILKHTGVKDYVAKDLIQIEHAVNFLDTYKQRGEFNLSTLKQLIDTPDKEGGWPDLETLLTEKTKKGIKELKDKYKKAA